MRFKGKLDPVFIDSGTSTLMREGGRFYERGWWGVDDNDVPQIGPYKTREECQAACDKANKKAD